MKTPNHLYIFHRPDGYYKIGISHNPYQRLEECINATVYNKHLGLKMLEFWQFDKLILGHRREDIVRKFERRLHNLFVRRRHEFDREYFELSNDDLKLAFGKLDILGERVYCQNPTSVLIPKADREPEPSVIEWINL